MELERFFMFGHAFSLESVSQTYSASQTLSNITSSREPILLVLVSHGLLPLESPGALCCFESLPYILVASRMSAP